MREMSVRGAPFEVWYESAMKSVAAVTWMPVLALLACSDDPDFAVREDEVCFERRDGQRICIEVYEASRQDADAESEGTSEATPRSTADRQPWRNVTWSAALEACRAKGKRLCDRDEWIDGCDGEVGEDVGTTYPYGNERDPALCNVTGGGPAAGGASPMCVSAFGTFDQGGNVWEWTGNTRAAAAARGGSFRSSQTHDCQSGDRTQRFDPELPNVEVGFRCCREAG